MIRLFILYIVQHSIVVFWIPYTIFFWKFVRSAPEKANVKSVSRWWDDNNDGVVPKRVWRPVESARVRCWRGIFRYTPHANRNRKWEGNPSGCSALQYTRIPPHRHHHHHLTKKYCYYYHYYCYFNSSGDHDDNDDDDDDDNRGASVKWCVYNTILTLMDNPFVAHTTPRR